MSAPILMYLYGLPPEVSDSVLHWQLSGNVGLGKVRRTEETMQGGREGVRVVGEEGGKKGRGKEWGEREKPHIPCIDVVRADLLKHQLQLDTR